MEFLELLKTGRPVLLDGGMGTMLQARGLPVGAAPETATLEHPEWLREIHSAYLDAGSQIVYANTFGANREKLAHCGRTVAEVVPAAVSVAREAARGRGLVALDVGPIGQLLEPTGTLEFEQAVDIFAEVVEAGAAAGADLIAIETMTDLQEARAALLVAREHSSLPVLVTMTYEATGRTFLGCSPACAALTLEGLGADAIGVNCSLGPREMPPLVEELLRWTTLPIVLKPNAGLPHPDGSGYDISPEEFAHSLAALADLGVQVFGGCCGTTPEYIALLRRELEGRTVRRVTRTVPAAVCSGTQAVPIDRVRVIGERINPTGKKLMKEALRRGDVDYMLNQALAQTEAGADILDVNVGFPGVNEVVMLPRVVKKLQSAIAVPLQLDSSNPDALEAGLRVYNGKAAVNSVNGEPEVLERVLPIVKKYGASVVGLTLDKNGIPKTAEERVAIARRILQAALDHGIPREDVWIDCLTLTVSAQQEQAAETLKAVRTIREELGLQVVLGVSNISFGLPNRKLITQNFLIQAMHAGLTLPIINPNQTEMMDAVAAYRVLSGEDRECRAYVARFAAESPAVQAAPKADALTLGDAVIRGLKADAGKLAAKALETEDELSLVENHLIPALDKVGEDYDKGTAFLPQLLSAAQAAQAVFEVIRSSIAAKGGVPVKKGKLIVATVQGDIHDIGKNIVKTVLGNYGYEVLDLGRDVPPETILRTVQEQGVRLVGLSALMTTTLPAMEKTIRLLHTMEEPPVIFVGGAVVTPEYAKQMNADYYAKDAHQSVEITRKVMG